VVISEFIFEPRKKAEGTEDTKKSNSEKAATTDQPAKH